MALVFNVPPNWPKMPEGWKPENGWQPDPEWGPAPDRWQFWVDDPSLDPEEPAKESVEEAPVVDVVEPVAPVEEPPEVSSSGTESLAVAAGAGTVASAAPSAQTTADVKDPFSEHINRAHALETQRTQKKKRKAALFWGVLVALVALIVGGIFVVTQNDDSADAQNVSATVATELPSVEATDETSMIPSAQTVSETSTAVTVVPGTQKELTGSFNAYEGYGEQVFDMIIPGGGGSYYTYEFAGENPASQFKIQGMDERNFENGYGIMDVGAAAAGSNVFDVAPDGTRTFKIRANGEGQWKVQLFPLDSAPVYAKGETVSGKGSAAFFYEGDPADIDVRFVVGKNAQTPEFALVQSPDIDRMAVPVVEAKNTLKKSLVTPSGKVLYTVTSTGGEWSLSFN